MKTPNTPDQKPSTRKVIIDVDLPEDLVSAAQRLNLDVSAIVGAALAREVAKATRSARGQD